MTTTADNHKDTGAGRIIVTTSGDTPRAPLEARFGRAPGFILYDLADDSFTRVDNTQNLNAAQGAGIQAAQTVVRTGAKALVTGHCGPKAFRVLSAAGVRVFTCDAATVEDAVTKYRAGELAECSAADVDGHWA